MFEMYRSKTDATFLKAFRNTYTKTTPFQKPNINGELLGFASMHKKSLGLVAGANELVAMFESVEQKISGLDAMDMLKNEWSDEDQRIETLMSEGREVGIAKFREILMARGGKADEGRVGAQFYLQERVMEGATGAWGEVARKQEKAIKRLVKSSAIVA